MQRRPGTDPAGASEQPERLPGGGSAAWPVVGYLVVAIFVVAALWDGFEALDLTVLAAGALLAGIVHVVLQRPAVGVDRDTVHLRGTLSTVHVPLAAVERVAVGRFLAVFAGEDRYVSPAVQRSVRAVMGRGPRRRADREGTPPDRERFEPADLVERRILQLAEDARARAGVALLSDEQLALATGVRRTWSPVAIALLVVPAAALLLGILFLL